MLDPAAFPQVYRAYGLVIRANLPIDYLLPAPEAETTDVLVDFVGDQPLDTSGGEILGTTPKVPIRWRLADGSLCTRIMLGGDYLQYAVNHDGTYIRLAQSPQVSSMDVSHYLIGVGLGILLRLRGRLCLHASVLALEQHAFLLIGQRGSGKSTTCTALAALGCRPMSDDLAAISEAAVVFPAYPYIRLRPEVASGIYQDAETTAHIWEVHGYRVVDKRYLSLEANGIPFQREPLPIHAIYLLDQRSATLSEPQIEAVHGLEKLNVLAPHGIARGFFADQAAAEFDQLLRLVNRVPVRRVLRSDDPASVTQVASAILKDLTTLLNAP